MSAGVKKRWPASRPTAISSHEAAIREQASQSAIRASGSAGTRGKLRQAKRAIVAASPAAMPAATPAWVRLNAMAGAYPAGIGFSADRPASIAPSAASRKARVCGMLSGTKYSPTTPRDQLSQ
ncbi:MAG: hypothetical protein QOD42_1771 [Sphingomonadales bacterium]|nr:hypothetical protein [Sphingomonadales bacterium]